MQKMKYKESLPCLSVSMIQIACCVTFRGYCFATREASRTAVAQARAVLLVAIHNKIETRIIIFLNPSPKDH